MPLVEQWYIKNTFSMDEGRQYLVKGIFQNARIKDDGYRVSYDRGTLNRLFRKDHCEACKEDSCLTLAIEGYVNIYGNDNRKFQSYIKDWHNTLQVDHKDGNRFNNDISNLQIIFAPIIMLLCVPMYTC